MKKNKDFRPDPASEKQNTRIHEAAVSEKSTKHGKTSEAARRRKLAAVQRRKERSRSISLSIFVIFIMILTVLIVLKIMKNNEPRPQFMFIQEGYIQHDITAKALLIRDETVIKAPGNGYLKPLIQSGSRVSFGQVAAVITNESDKDDLETLKNYEQQISKLQNELVIAGKGTGAKAVYDEAHQDISAQIDLIRRGIMTGIINDLNSFTSSIKIAVQRRDNRLSGIDFNDSRLDELKSQKEALENSLELVAGNIVVNTPGILSYNLDGLETELTMDMIDTMSIDQFKEYTESNPGHLETDRFIENDEGALKVAKGIYQYIVTAVPVDTEDGFPTDSVHTIYVPDKGTEITDCEVVRKYIQGDQALIAFRTDREIVRFADVRVIDISLSIRRTEGLKIPFSSITNISDNGSSGDIMLVVSGYTKKISVEIVDHDGEYAIIKAQKEDDEAVLLNGYLVKNPDSVSEGENFGT